MEAKTLVNQQMIIVEYHLYTKQKRKTQIPYLRMALDSVLTLESPKEFTQYPYSGKGRSLIGEWNQ